MRVTLSLRATSATGGTLKTQSSCQANHTLNDLILKEKFYHSVIIYLMPETKIRFQSSVHLGTNPKEWARPQTPWFSSDISTWMMSPVTSIVSGRVEEKGVGKLDVFCLGPFASSCFPIFATIFRTCRRWKKKSAKSVRRRYRRPESLQSCRSAWMISRKKHGQKAFKQVALYDICEALKKRFRKQAARGSNPSRASCCTEAPLSLVGSLFVPPALPTSKWGSGAVKIVLGKLALTFWFWRWASLAPVQKESIWVREYFSFTCTKHFLVEVVHREAARDASCLRPLKRNCEMERLSHFRWMPESR